MSIFETTNSTMNNNLTKVWLLLVALFEGGTLMSVEVISSKLLAPHYGTSVYAWAAVFTVTLLGLASGYYYGGRLSSQKSLKRLLNLMLVLGAVFVFIMPWWSSFLASALGVVSFKFSLLITLLLFLFPPLFFFGTVSPIAIQMLNHINKDTGKNAGLIFGTSTFGGVVCTFLFGFYLIPFQGIMSSTIIAFGLILMSFVFSLLVKVNE